MTENINAISLSTSVFSAEKGPGCRLTDYIAIAAEAGYPYIELSRRQHAGTRAAIPAIRESGLKVWSVHGILDGGALSEDENIRKNAVESAYRRAADAAEFAPCPIVEHYIFRHHDPGKGERFRRSIEELFEKILPFGYILCIETAPNKVSNERYPDSAEIAEFVRSFRHENLRMTVDLNHSNLAEDLVQVAKNTAGLVRNIHVSDNHGQYEDHLPPGEGIIDFRTAFRALRENGYTGPCNLEFHAPDPERVPSADFLRSIRLRMENMLFSEPMKKGKYEK